MGPISSLKKQSSDKKKRKTQLQHFFPAGGESINIVDCTKGMSSSRTNAAIILLASRGCMLMCLELYAWKRLQSQCLGIQFVCLSAFCFQDGEFWDRLLGTMSAECEMNRSASPYLFGGVSKRDTGLDSLSSDFPFLIKLW